jgi:hypothetical protein
MMQYVIKLDQPDEATFRYIHVSSGKKNNQSIMRGRDERAIYYQ